MKCISNAVIMDQETVKYDLFYCLPFHTLALITSVTWYGTTWHNNCGNTLVNEDVCTQNIIFCCLLPQTKDIEATLNHDSF